MKVSKQVAVSVFVVLVVVAAALYAVTTHYRQLRGRSDNRQQQMAALLEQAKTQHPGFQVMRTHLENQGAHTVYVIELADKSGQRLKLSYDFGTNAPVAR